MTKSDIIKEECCEKCGDTLGSSGYGDTTVCMNKDCPCHRSIKAKGEEWNQN